MNFSLKPNINGNTFLPLRSREHHRREGGKNLKAGGWGNVSQNTPSRYDRWTRKEEDGTQKEKIGGTGGVIDMHIIRVPCIYVSNCQK